MNTELLFDPLFREPFATGLLFAVLLPLLGAYLRLRDEWLAALSYAQLAAAGSLLAMLGGIPLAAGGLVAAALAALLKNLFERAGNAAYAMLLLTGWGVSVLLVSNLPLAERMGHALFDGQLYFTDTRQLATAAGYFVLALTALWPLSRRLLLAHFFPDYFRARGLSERRAHLAFDLVAAGALALATMSIGVMAAFGLIFVPPLVAYRWGRSWKRALALAVAVGVACYAAAFATALLIDQPFGPLLALILVAVGGSALAFDRRGRR